MTTPSWLGRASIALASLALIAGCGGGGEEHDTTIRASDRRVGAEQHPLLLAEFGGAYDGDEAAYLRRIGTKIATAAGLADSCTFTLVNSDVVNAFAVPGCYIYVTRGLMAVMNSEAELASVLAHELGHIVGQHSRRQQRRSILRQLGVAAVALLTESERLTRIAGEAAQYFTLRYSRKQEYESDDLGIRFLRQAGYDPYAAADMLAQLAAQEHFLSAAQAPDDARGIPEWARTHPLTENRIERAKGVAAATGIAPDALPENEAGFLREIDGLLYGDDPRQGFVLGRKFAHPTMRVAFEAPAGFTLSNSPRAVLIRGPDGVRGEFGAGPAPAGGLEAYASRLIGELLGDAAAQARIGPARPRSINGVQSLTVPVRLQTPDGLIDLRIAAYAGGQGTTYHFILVARNASEGAVTALFDSFRFLDTAEIAALRARRIVSRPALAGETVQGVARQMASDRPLDHFLMLNGRAKDQPLRPGELVKLITYVGPKPGVE